MAADPLFPAPRPLVARQMAVGDGHLEYVEECAARYGLPHPDALPDAPVLPAPRQLLAGVERLRHLPATIVQGLAAPVCPPQVAEKLHRAWPEATWLPIADGGHGGLSAPIGRAALRRWAGWRSVR